MASKGVIGGDGVSEMARLLALVRSEEQLTASMTRRKLRHLPLEDARLTTLGCFLIAILLRV
jgi:hypothetical protein